MDTEETRIAIFQGKNIRRILQDGEWWFVVEDIVAGLTDTTNPKDYINKMRIRDTELAKGYGQIVHTLPIQTAGGKQGMNCANTAGVLRIIQSIPSSKAEPFKRWLAKVGYDRIQEIENPELAQVRMKKLYEQKGYSQAWIDKRLRGITIRQDLTDEWKTRGISKESDFAILTGEISKATFGMTPSEYKKHKHLKRENLRDHMTDLELIFTMLGEKVTTEISKIEKPTDLPKNKVVAQRGGGVAGKARIDAEKEIGHTIISSDNYINEPESIKRLK